MGDSNASARCRGTKALTLLPKYTCMTLPLSAFWAEAPPPHTETSDDPRDPGVSVKLRASGLQLPGASQGARQELQYLLA